MTAAEWRRPRTVSGSATPGLNVFGGNTVTRGLYESGGSEINSLHMVKSLTS